LLVDERARDVAKIAPDDVERQAGLVGPERAAHRERPDPQQYADAQQSAERQLQRQRAALARERTHAL
jgi:hypothetical protein